MLVSKRIHIRLGPKEVERSAYSTDREQLGEDVIVGFKNEKVWMLKIEEFEWYSVKY